MAKENRRIAKRVDLKVMVQAEHESRLQQYYSKNISGGGIFLETKELVPIGQEMVLSFSIPGRKKPLKITAKVARHHVMESMGEDFNPTTIQGVGLAFIDVSSEDQRDIEHYVLGKGLAVQG